MHNWSKSIEFNAATHHEPTNLDELSKLVAASAELKALGSAHSFSRIADTYGSHVSLTALGKHMELDRVGNTVTINSSLRYAELGEFLWHNGYALHNVASLPHISVAGACATATHGSGDGNGNLATAVQAMQIIAGDGSIRSLSRAEYGESFDGMVVHLGALGVVTRLTLSVVPAFQVAQRVYEGLAFEEVRHNLDSITGAAYSVSFFTKWCNEVIDQVWLKELVSPTAQNRTRSDFHGAQEATRNLHPIRELCAEPCTEQLGVAGPWHERLPHFRPTHLPSSGSEIQTEYFVDRDKAVEAMQRLFAMGDRISPTLQISEVRTVAADGLWLSPCYQRPKVGIHFTWKKEPEAVARLLPVIERELADLTPIPHWAKVFSMDRDTVRSRYPRLADFQQIARDFDPRGILCNPFLKEYVL